MTYTSRLMTESGDAAVGQVPLETAGRLLARAGFSVPHISVLSLSVTVTISLSLSLCVSSEIEMKEMGCWGLSAMVLAVCMRGGIYSDREEENEEEEGGEEEVGC